MNEPRHIGAPVPADAPILTLAVTSKTLPLTQVQNLVDTRLASKLSQLPGVGVVSLSGGFPPPALFPIAGLSLRMASGGTVEIGDPDSVRAPRAYICFCWSISASHWS